MYQNEKILIYTLLDQNIYFQNNHFHSVCVRVLN